MSKSSEEHQQRIAHWRAAVDSARGRLAPAGVAALARRSGLQFLEAIGRGELPSVPIGHTLDFWPIEVEHGRMVFQGEPAVAHLNPLGTVHGGWIATLLDSALACAVQSTVPVGSGSTTLELKINYVRALTAGAGPVRAEGKVIQAGARVGTAEGRLTDAAGRLYAFATTTCLVVPIAPAA